MNTITASPFLFSSNSVANDDTSLIARFQGGDESAFVQIVRAHRDRIHGYVRSLLRDETDAEEVTQDTFVRAYRALNRFRGDASLSTWLHRIATNLARNRYWYFFRRRRQDTISLDWEGADGNTSPLGETFACDRPDPRQHSAREEFLTAVRECVQSIDPLFREPFELRAAKGMNYNEIATRLGVPTGTVKSRIARARQELRQLLAARLPDLADATSLADCFDAGRH